MAGRGRLGALGLAQRVSLECVLRRRHRGEGVPGLPPSGWSVNDRLDQVFRVKTQSVRAFRSSYSGFRRCRPLSEQPFIRVAPPLKPVEMSTPEETAALALRWVPPRRRLGSAGARARLGGRASDRCRAEIDRVVDTARRSEARRARRRSRVRGGSGVNHREAGANAEPSARPRRSQDSRAPRRI